MTGEIWDRRRCELGEGLLWHPGRQQLFWFDILRGLLLSRDPDGPLEWDLGEYASAAGWIDHDTLLVATESRLMRFDVRTGRSESLCGLEAENPQTRSNDGRADPWGGFWIGTMGRRAEPEAGAIYRYFRGELRPLHERITIPNAICFAPDGRCAYFADSKAGLVWRQSLDGATGWPEGAVEVWLDLRSEGLVPDGAVTDADGCFWNAQWGASRVACYDPEGRFQRAITFGADHTACPAFGGADFATLFCASALSDLPEARRDAAQNGMTLAAASGTRGRPEPAVIP